MMHPITLPDNGNIQTFTGPHALNWLRSDFATKGRANLWAYLIDPVFFLSLASVKLKTHDVCILIDHRQKPVARALAAQSPRLHVATWSTNRTMHTKTLHFPDLGVVWFTTANLTRGAWTLSENHSLRIECQTFSNAIAKTFYTQFSAARPLLPGRRN